MQHQIVFSVHSREKNEEITFIEDKPYTYGFYDIYKATDWQVSLVVRVVFICLFQIHYSTYTLLHMQFRKIMFDVN
jgi:hypothetical protein